MAYTESDRKYFYPEIIRKVSVGFMSLFQNIRVAKNDADGNLINYRNVPIVFGSKGNALADLERSNSDAGFEYSQYLPKMAAIMTGFEPNRSRVQGAEIRPMLKYPLNESEYNRIYGTTPMKMLWTLSILTLHISEMNQILEQVLVHFNPYKTITIREFDFIPDFTRDLKVVLTGTTADIADEVDEQNIRKILWDINFEIDCFLYKPILFSDVIKTVVVEMIDQDTLNDMTTFTYAVSGDSVDNFTVVTDEWNEDGPQPPVPPGG